MMKTVDGASGDDLDLHPRADRAMFLPRLGYGQQGLVQLLVARGVRTTVAPLYYMGHNPELSLVPIRHRMGSVLDPCTQISGSCKGHHAARRLTLARIATEREDERRDSCDH
jgi:hypothetical protein